MNHPIHPLQQHPGNPVPNKTKTPAQKSTQTDFKQLLETEQNLSITKHAKQRMRERKIDLSDAEWKQLNEKTAEARQKGVTDSIVLKQDAALLVSVKNNAIITAMNKEEAVSKLFTDINGAILIDA